MPLALIFIEGGKIKYNGVITVWNFAHISDESMRAITPVAFVACASIFALCCTVGGCWNEL